MKHVISKANKVSFVGVWGGCFLGCCYSLYLQFPLAISFSYSISLLVSLSLYANYNLMPFIDLFSFKLFAQPHIYDILYMYILYIDSASNSPKHNPSITHNLSKFDI